MNTTSTAPLVSCIKILLYDGNCSTLLKLQIIQRLYAHPEQYLQTIRDFKQKNTYYKHNFSKSIQDSIGDGNLITYVLR